MARQGGFLSEAGGVYIGNCPKPRRAMADVLVLLLILAFFAICVAFVRGCDRIIGPDEPADTVPAPEVEAMKSETVGAAR